MQSALYYLRVMIYNGFKWHYKMSSYFPCTYHICAQLFVSSVLWLTVALNDTVWCFNLPANFRVILSLSYYICIIIYNGSKMKLYDIVLLSLQLQSCPHLQITPVTWLSVVLNIFIWFHLSYSALFRVVLRFVWPLIII